MSFVINKELLDNLLEHAKDSPRLRMNYDLRTSEADTSQRMLNALQPGTEVLIHRHEDTAETVVCLLGRLEEIIYEELHDGTYQEVSRHLLCPLEGIYGMQVPMGAWHTIRVLEPSVIFEAKDGAFVPR
ncbi:MAG: WbuC family cupin fold metalloprotein [Bacteroides sp.]|nr:WbuC family cupin fold metalloprotein [Bacteroides sp.]